MLMACVMPENDQKRRDSMTSYFTQKAQQAENRWLSRLLPSIFLAVGSLIATVDSASLAAAAECQVTDLRDGGMIPGMTTGKGTTLSILPLTITVERNTYGGLVPPLVPQVAPDLNSSRIAWGTTKKQGLARIGACLSQDIRKSALFNQPMIRSIVKSPARAHTPFMKVPVLLYNGKKPGLTIRTTHPEIGISVPYKVGTLIGPVQEIRKPILSDARSESQTVAALPYTFESSSSFGGQAFGAVNPFQSALQLPDNESMRMNMTTMHAVHVGNCASGCP